MFEIDQFTEATLTSVTPRVEKHGDDDKPAVSLGFEITTGAEMLDLIDKALRPTIYKRPDTETLPGFDDVLNVLACNSIDRIVLTTKHEGWTLEVDDGIDDSAPMNFGGSKVDKLSIEPHQGGNVTLRLRVGTSDLDAARAGMLGMHVGQPLWIKLVAPKPGDEPKTGVKLKEPDATDLFAGKDEADEDDEPSDLEERLDQALDGAYGPTTKPGDDDHVAWPFPQNGNNSMEAPPQAVTVERAQPGTRTARGMEQTRAALAAGAAKANLKAKYRCVLTGETWSGRGLMPKWLKIGIERGKALSDYAVVP